MSELAATGCLETCERVDKMSYKIHACPVCGKRQKIVDLSGFSSKEQECKPSIYTDNPHSFYVNPDLTVREFTKEEHEILKQAWINFAKSPELIHNQ